MDTTGTPTQFGPEPTPGLAILSDPQGANWEWASLCTLGPAIRDDAEDREGFISDWICEKSGTGEVVDQRIQTAANLDGLAGTKPIGTLTDGDWGSGLGALWVGKVGQSAVRIADTWPVAGVLAATSAAMSSSRADARPSQRGLRQGTPVCLNGATSGVVCGPLIDPGDIYGGEMEFGVSTAPGPRGDDLGAPVFLVDGDTGTATLIGIVEGGKGGSTFASLLEPELLRLKAVALVDAAAAATVAGHPDYSVHVAPQSGTTEAKVAASAAVGNWITAPASAKSVPAGELAPGAEILVGKLISAGVGGCTLSAGIRRGGRPGFLTAGHCGEEGDEVRLDSPDGLVIGRIGERKNLFDEKTRCSEVVGICWDYAAVWTDVPAPKAATIAGLPVAGVMTREAAAGLPRGTPICFDGRTSGLVCSPKWRDNDNVLFYDEGSNPGDSGSPAFLIDENTGAATLVGILSSQIGVTFLDPVLERLGADVLVDPVAAAAVAGDPRYSTRVTPLN